MVSSKPPVWANRPSRSFLLFSSLLLSIAFVLIVLFVAPSLSWQQSGSTYNRSPDGYGAWYAYMTEKRGVTITRFKQPLNELISRESPRLLLRIQPKLVSAQLDQEEQRWLDAGNSLVIVGVRQAMTKAPFSRKLSSRAGAVKVETARRSRGGKDPILADEYGAVVWQPQQRLTYVATPHLAANAYQGEPGNFPLLEQLVTQAKQPIFVDEFVHGYRQAQPKQPWPWGVNFRGRRNAPDDNVFSYLSRTPLAPVFVQGMIVLLIAVLAKNRRFGRLQSVTVPQLDNSEAYMQALSGALRQADSRDFVMETVNKAELRSLQRQMGLGDESYGLEELIQVAQQQAPNERADLLRQLCKIQQQRRVNDESMIQWLTIWQKLRR